jgi:transcriptional regulator GlxA family with amidase domain
MTKTNAPFTLGLVLFPGCMPAGLFATSDLVRACNLRAGQTRMNVKWVGVEPGVVPTHRGPAVQAETSFFEAKCDAWLLPGLWVASATELDAVVQVQHSVVQAVRGLPERTQVWSYCAGVALAAAAGRLDRQAATATWWLQPTLAARFPRVQWRSTADLAIGESAITAAGPSGYLPLIINRLAHHFDEDVLQDVQELLMLPSPRSRHEAFERVDMMRLDEPALRSLLSWAQSTPAQDLTLTVAARQQNVSTRTLARLVDRVTGVSAGEWLRLVKLSQAADALRTTSAPIKRISEKLGFAAEANFYRAFRAATKMTPTAYRQAYGARTVDQGKAPR